MKEMYDRKTIIVILNKLLEVEYTTSSQLEKLTGLEKMDLYKYFRKFKKEGIETSFKKGEGYFIKGVEEGKIMVKELEKEKTIVKELKLDLESITELMETRNGMELEPAQAIKLIKIKLNIKDWYGEEEVKKLYWEWRSIWKTRKRY